MRQTFIISIMLLLSQFVKAEDAFLFRHLDTSRGLSNNSVMSLLIDSQGFLWAGTESGLNRYDGYEVSTTYMIGESFELNNISYMEEDKQGHIWIENSASYVLYNVKNHTFTNNAGTYLKSLGFKLKGDYRVKVATDGLWVIEDGRLQYYDYESAKVRSWSVPNLNIVHYYSKGSSASSYGLYISFDNELWHFSINTGRIQHIEITDHRPAGTNTFSTFIDNERTVWIYSIVNDMLCKYSVGGKVVSEYIKLGGTDHNSANNAIRDMLDDGNGNIWIATDHDGVFIYNKQTENVRNISHKIDANSISSDNVTCMKMDSQGTVWMGHYKTGISYTSTNHGIFRKHGEQYGDVSTLAYDRDGNLWIGTDGEGLYMERKDGSYVKASIPKYTISSIVSDNDGGVWVGCYNKGLYHLTSPTDFTYYSIEKGNLLSNNAWYIVDDGLGAIWYSSATDALIRFDKKTEKSHFVRSDNNEPIYGNAISIGKGGIIYAGSFYGLWTINPKTHCKMWQIGNRQGKPFLSPMITCEYCDAKRDILLLGHLNGTTIYDLHTDSVYYVREQYSNSRASVRSIIADHAGNYWVSTSKGLSCLTIKREGSRLTINSHNYTAQEGLQATYFNSKSCAISPQGVITFGGIFGLTSVYPESFASSEACAQKPMITDVIIGNQQLDFSSGKIILDHDNTNTVIKYFTGNLNNTRHIRFAYKLNGVMNDWAYTEENRISLVGLSHGRYTLLIKSCGSNDEWSDECQLDIEVRPPFYLSWWMQMLYLLIAIATIYLAFRYYHNRQTQRLVVEKEDMERKKQALLTEMKLKFFTNISHDLRTPLTLIISPLETVVKKMENGESVDQSLPVFKNILKNAQLLYSQVTSLLDFRRLDVGVEALQADISDIVAQLNSICMSFHDYAEEKGIALSFQSADDSFLMSYDKKKMNKIIYNLLSNAFKFTPMGGSITVSFSRNDDQTTIEVADTGKGISDEDKKNIFNRFYQSGTNDDSLTGSGIGLHIANEYVQMHQGTLSVRDNGELGSVFSITIPIAEQTPTEAADINKVEETATDTERNTVLIVDDNSDMLTFIKSNLEQTYNILTANDGQEALNMLTQHTVSLVVSDVMMPVMDGLELCRRMKSDINLSHIPIILLTARTTDDNQLEGLQLGADDYVTKPFNMEVLALRIAKFMEWATNAHRQFREKIEVKPSEITITPLDEQLIQNAIRIVEEHISDSNFTVESLGQAVGMSRSFLYKKLMAITGQGPAEFIRTIRIKRGKALLEKSQMQVTEIAYAVGFNSLKSFSMNFKAEYGMSPTEYLKSLA